MKFLEWGEKMARRGGGIEEEHAGEEKEEQPWGKRKASVGLRDA